MGEQRQHRSWRRSLAAAVGVGMAASLAAVMIPAPAAAIPGGGVCEPDQYHPTQNHGEVMHPVEPTHSIFNPNPNSFSVTFSSATSATVTSYATGGSAWVNIAVVNAAVQAWHGLPVSHSVTTQAGYTVGPLVVPPGKTQFGNHGVYMLHTSGTYWKQDPWCTEWTHFTIGAYSARAPGWQLWQS